MNCVLPACTAAQADLTALWGRRICYRHLAGFQRWPASPTDRAPTRDEWVAFLAWLTPEPAEVRP